MTPQGQPQSIRCFVTGIEVERPDHNRLVSVIEFKADHAERVGFSGTLHVVDGSKFYIGQVITVNVEVQR